MEFDKQINDLNEDFNIRDLVISKEFLLQVLKHFNNKLHDDIENSITGGTENVGNFPVSNPSKGSIYLYNGKIYYCIKSDRGEFTSPDYEHFEEMSLNEVFRNFIRYKDIVNDLTTGGSNKPLSAEMGKVIKSTLDNKADKNGSYETLHAGTSTKWSRARNISLTGGASGSSTIDGSVDVSINVTEVKSSSLRGEIPIEIIPKGAIPNLVVVGDDSTRFRLNKNQIQNGDTVQVTSTGKMYFVVDDNRLNSEDGYRVYTAGSATSVPWSGVTGKPGEFPPASHNHDDRYYTESEINSKLSNAYLMQGQYTINYTNFNQTLAMNRVFRLGDSNSYSGVPSGMEYGQVVVLSGSYDTAVQMAFPYSINKFYFRTSNFTPGVDINRPWSEVWHDGNFDPNTKLNNSQISGYNGFLTGTAGVYTGGGNELNFSSSSEGIHLNWSYMGNAKITKFYFHDGSSTDTYNSTVVAGTFEAINAINCKGNITGAKVYNAVWNDYAEFFERGEETEPGDIIALNINSDKEVYVKASIDNPIAVGVHSDSFAHIIGGEDPKNGEDFFEYNISKYIPVGLAGRIYTKVVGEIKKGDFIGLSDIPGVGKKVEKTDKYIGISLEDKNYDGISKIKVLIK